jgi:hypothetical protein
MATSQLVHHSIAAAPAVNIAKPLKGGRAYFKRK